MSPPPARKWGNTCGCATPDIGGRKDIAGVSVGVVSDFCASEFPIILSIEKSAFDDGGLVLEMRGDTDNALARSLVGSDIGGSGVREVTSCGISDGWAAIIGEIYGYVKPEFMTDGCGVCGAKIPWW